MKWWFPIDTLEAEGRGWGSLLSTAGGWVWKHIRYFNESLKQEILLILFIDFVNVIYMYVVISIHQFRDMQLEQSGISSQFWNGSIPKLTKCQ